MKLVWGALMLMGCGFSSTEQRDVDAALVAGVQVTKRREFSEILTTVLGCNASAEANPAGWVLGQYASAGLFRRDQVRAWHPLKLMFTSTTAVTTPGVDSTGLNVWLLNRSVDSIMNTLVHERVHSFGFVHREGQTRPANVCDAAYVAGDLAEVLNSGKCPDEGVCPALSEELVTRRVVKSCKKTWEPQ